MSKKQAIEKIRRRQKKLERRARDRKTVRREIARQQPAGTYEVEKWKK